MKALFKKKKLHIDGVLGIVQDLEQVDQAIFGETQGSSFLIAKHSKDSRKEGLDEPLFDSTRNIIIRQPNMRVETPVRKVNSSMASDLINPLHSQSLHEDPNILLIDNASIRAESINFA